MMTSISSAIGFIIYYHKYPVYCNAVVYITYTSNSNNESSTVILSSKENKQILLITGSDSNKL